MGKVKTTITKFEGGIEWHIRSNGEHWLQIMCLEKVRSIGAVAERNEIAWAYLDEKQEHIIAIAQTLACNTPMVPGILYGVGPSCLLKCK